MLITMITSFSARKKWPKTSTLKSGHNFAMENGTNLIGLATLLLERLVLHVYGLVYMDHAMNMFDHLTFGQKKNMHCPVDHLSNQLIRNPFYHKSNQHD